MTDKLHLTEELIQQLIAAVKQHDPECDHELSACQYLSAAVAYLIGRQNTDNAYKAEMLGEIVEFIRYVYDDTIRQQPMPTMEPQQAFGIWKPPEP